MPIIFKIFSWLASDHYVGGKFCIPFHQFYLDVFTEEKVAHQKMFGRDEVLVRERVRANEFAIIDRIKRAVNKETKGENHGDADVFESFD